MPVLRWKDQFRLVKRLVDRSRRALRLGGRETEGGDPGEPAQGEPRKGAKRSERGQFHGRTGEQDESGLEIRARANGLLVTSEAG